MNYNISYYFVYYTEVRVQRSEFNQRSEFLEIRSLSFAASLNPHKCIIYYNIVYHIGIGLM